MNKRLSAMLLALTTVLPALTACSETASETTPYPATEENIPQETPALPAETENPLKTVQKLYADRDYNGCQYRILDRALEPDTNWRTFDVYAEEITGEPINDAVFLRNTALEETLKIEIVEYAKASSDVTPTLRTSIMAQSDDYDIFTDGIGSVTPLVAERGLCDMRQIPTLHPENPWWDQKIYRDLSLLNRTYFLTGDISVMDNYGTWCYLFNKQMIGDYGLDNPYELVNEGTWTLDKHNEMAEAATRDLDGDGKWTTSDSYGLLTEAYNVGALWSCLDNHIISKDENDLPYFTYDGEKEIDSMMRSVNCQYAPFTNMGSHSTVIPGVGNQEHFTKGLGLFYYGGMGNITIFRGSDTDFGVLPAPKYDETQAEYLSSYSTFNFTVYAIPVTCSDTEKIGDITEAMAHLSSCTLTPAYYDITLLGKATRDKESEPMIELILAGRNYDLGIVFNWGSVFGHIAGMTDASVAASTMAKIKKPTKRELDRYLRELQKD